MPADNNTPLTLSSPYPDTSLLLFTTASLEHSPYLQSIYNLINLAFNGHPWIATAHQRLYADTQFLKEIGPEGFIYVLIPTSPQGDSATNGTPPPIIATGSARPYDFEEQSKIPGGRISAFMRTGHVKLETHESWEMKLLAVQPSTKGTGIGSWLVKLIEGEIARRVIASSGISNEELGKGEGEGLANGNADEDSKGEVKEVEVLKEGDGKSGGKKVTLLISTLREQNEAFYLRRGWLTTKATPMEKGSMGGEEGFSIVFMEKEL